MSTILVIDDEQMIRLAFEEFLRDEGHEPLLAADAGTAMEMVRFHRPDIIFLDYRLPGKDGLQLLAEIRAARPEVAVIFMTAFGAMDVVITAMQRGAYEYLTKPLDLPKVRELINRIVASRQKAGAAPASASGYDGDTGTMVGKSLVMQEIFKLIGILTTQDVTVLITGESGVGKELVARALHRYSPRRDRPFVAVNCAAMPEQLMESELFGYEKGAFTGAEQRRPGKFEAAGRGTIFLDEIGELALPLQAKLLRVLQERSFERLGGNNPIAVEARILTATNKDLRAETCAGRFRQDLFYRLCLAHLHIPPLRERPDDIPALVRYFIVRFNSELGTSIKDVTPETLSLFHAYPWPGNIRELEHAIKRAMVLCRDDILGEELFSLVPTPKAGQEEAAAPSDLAAGARQAIHELWNQDEEGHPLERIVKIVEETLLREALARAEGNQVRAAKLLGIHRTTLRTKIVEYGLDREGL